MKHPIRNLVVVALAATLSLMTAPFAQAAPTRTTVTYSTKSPTYGSAFKVAGAVSPAKANTAIWLQRFDNKSGWVPVASTRTNSAGKYSVSAKALVPGSVYYRISTARNGSADPTVSLPTTFSVSRAASASVAYSSAPKLGKTFTAVGHIRPGVAGTVVWLQRRPNSSSAWVPVATATTNSAGRFSISTTLKVSGSQQFRVSAAAKAPNRAAVTSPKTINIAKSAASGTLTTQQKKAVESAKNYLEVLSFSRQDLIDQLVYDGFALNDAKVAVDHLKADWNAQAVKSARTYLELFDLTRQELVDQLLWDGFTSAQAEHAANVVSSSSSRAASASVAYSSAPKLGKTFTAVGHIRPGVAGTVVWLQRRPNSSSAWIPVAKATTNPEGRFSISTTLKVSGSQQFRVSAAAKAPNRAAVTSPKTINIAKPQAAPKPAGPIGSNCPASAPIKGNDSSSGEKIYHVPGGAFYSKTVPEKCFSSESAARSAGYRASLR